MQADMGDATPWWTELFDDWFAEQMFGDWETKASVAFLTERLGLKPGMRVLDQCCGIGTVAIALAGQGMSLVGVDQSESYIARARDDASTRQLQPEFVAADALEFTPSQQVDSAYNWGMSFGYYGSDDDNQRMLTAAFEALLPGGAFALETTCLPAVLRTFQHSHVMRQRTGRGEVMLLRENRLDLFSGQLEQHWTYLLDGKVAAERESSARLYAPDVVVAMMRRAGFGDIKIFGTLRGAPLGFDSPRLIAVGHKPA
jgi:ubiquinone/menaquinone biosynthesis C-methylase UbiE